MLNLQFKNNINLIKECKMFYTLFLYKSDIYNNDKCDSYRIQ